MIDMRSTLLTATVCLAVVGCSKSNRLDGTDRDTRAVGDTGDGARAGADGDGASGHGSSADGGVGGGATTGRPGPGPDGAATAEPVPGGDRWPAPWSAGECVATDTWTGSTYCERQLECERGRISVNCGEEGGAWTCSCEHELGNKQYRTGYQVDSVAASQDVCTDVASLCAAGSSAPQPAQCSDTFLDSSAQHCDTLVECRRSADLGNGISESYEESHDTHCEYAGGIVSCWCSGPDYDLRIDLDEGQGSTESCGTVSDACTFRELEPFGTTECIPVQQYAEREYCFMEFDCIRPARLDDLGVQIVEQRGVSCDTARAGVWNCNCDGSASTGNFQISTERAWDACTEAGTHCGF